MRAIPWLIGSPWGFAEETAIHALRLMGSGLFDEYPKLKIVIGHLGERIPYDLWRLDHRLANVPGRPAKRTMGDYFRQNFYVTTSGHFSTPSLIQAILTVGADRLLFAVDYPFEDHAQGVSWFDAPTLPSPTAARSAATTPWRCLIWAEPASSKPILTFCSSDRCCDPPTGLLASADC